jgi:hypothetical protein
MAFIAFLDHAKKVLKLFVFLGREFESFKTELAPGHRQALAATRSSKKRTVRET